MSTAESHRLQPVNPPRSKPPRGFFDITPEDLAELLASWNQPRYRAVQIMEWVYTQLAPTYEAMSNLPKGLRQRLVDELPLYRGVVLRESRSQDDTIKRLLAWEDGATSECVMIPDGERRTACISTQVGCPVKCVFCASGLGGLDRQLTAGQIVEQAMHVRRMCAPERLSNVVWMGLGEPLANYDATVRSIRTINAAWGLGIGARKLTVSTVGLPGQIQRLADENIQVTLAISLHAPNDELRKRIIPWAQRVTIEALVEAGSYFFQKTGREITLEYILLGGLNDQRGHAQELVSVARRLRSNVNLLQYNPVDGLPYQRPDDQAARRFLMHLREAGVNAHLRRSRGRDIDAACGQLRRRERGDQTA